jgi:hypothetical protein
MDDLLVGREYKVTIDDCCVKGEFTAVLTWLVRSEEGETIDEIRFQNGVELTWMLDHAVKFEAVK